jgi:hypothetical protein
MGVKKINGKKLIELWENTFLGQVREFYEMFGNGRFLTIDTFWLEYEKQFYPFFRKISTKYWNSNKQINRRNDLSFGPNNIQLHHISKFSLPLNTNYSSNL